jgi:hypothetical protein
MKKELEKMENAELNVNELDKISGGKIEIEGDTIILSGTTKNGQQVRFKFNNDDEGYKKAVRTSYQLGIQD